MGGCFIQYVPKASSRGMSMNSSMYSHVHPVLVIKWA